MLEIVDAVVVGISAADAVAVAVGSFRSLADVDNAAAVALVDDGVPGVVEARKTAVHLVHPPHVTSPPPASGSVTTTPIRCTCICSGDSRECLVGVGPACTIPAILDVIATLALKQSFWPLRNSET